MTTLTRPVTRKVPSLSFGDLAVTVTVEGLVLRQHRHRQNYLLPWGLAFQRAVTLHVEAARDKKGAKRGGTRRAR